MTVGALISTAGKCLLVTFKDVINNKMLFVNGNNNKMLSVNEKIIERMLEALNTDVSGLAEFLGNTPESISMWKKRSVPIKAVMKVANTTGVSFKWILGETTSVAEDGYMPIQPPKVRSIADLDAPIRISDLLTGYSPEAKAVADAVEIRLSGKSTEERAAEIQRIMEEIWKKI